MEFMGGRSPRMAAWTHIREREKRGTHGGRWSRLWNRCSHHGNKSANGATVRRRGETSERKSGNPRGSPGRPFARAQKNTNGKNEGSPRGWKSKRKRGDLVSHSYEAEVTVDQRFQEIDHPPTLQDTKLNKTYRQERPLHGSPR